MRITHDVRPAGHFVTIHHDNAEFTLRTEKGTDSELAEHAVEMRKSARALTRRADLIKLAIHGHCAPDPLQRLISAASYVVSCYGTGISESAIVELQEAIQAARDTLPPALDAIRNLIRAAERQLDQSATAAGLENCDILAAARKAVQGV